MSARAAVAFLAVCALYLAALFMAALSPGNAGVAGNVGLRDVAETSGSARTASLSVQTTRRNALTSFYAPLLGKQEPSGESARISSDKLQGDDADGPQSDDALSASAPGKAKTGGSDTSRSDSAKASGANGPQSGDVASASSSSKVKTSGADASQSGTAKTVGAEASQSSKASSKAASDKQAVKITGKTLRKSVPGAAKLTTFSIGDGSAPSLEKAQSRAIEKAIDEIEETECACGFVFVDLISGKGAAFNADEVFYTASAFKAALSYYVLTEDEPQGISDYDRDNMESAIKYSDNDAYDALAAGRIDDDYLAWLERYGIAYDSASPYYATASAKSMVRIWADLVGYLQTGSDDAKWFSGLLEQTNRSFIRDALEDEHVIVRNKAGWIAEYHCNATTDCAFIKGRKRGYIMVVLTDQPNCDAASARAGQLARALYGVRKALI